MITEYKPVGIEDNKLSLAVPIGDVQKYVYGLVPPTAPAIAEPVESPAQFTESVETILETRIAGSLITAVSITVQPLSSVMVTIQDPIESVPVESIAEPVLQEYKYGAVPPFPLAIAYPSFPPLQFTSEIKIELFNTDGS